MRDVHSSDHSPFRKLHLGYRLATGMPGISKFAANRPSLGRDTLLLTHNEKLARGKARVGAFNLSIARSADTASARQGVLSGTFGNGTGTVETAGVFATLRARRISLDTL
jgi:hypothetical protein